MVFVAVLKVHHSIPW